MNSNGLANHYDRLTPWERVPMIWAAEARGDVAEMQRLAKSAPRVSFRVADCLGLDQGLLWLAAVVRMQQLDLAALYGKAAMLLETSSTILSKKHHDRIWKMMRLLAYRIVVNADSWKLVCADLNIDPSWLVSSLPGYDTVTHTEEQAREVAFTQDEAEAYLRQNQEAESKAEENAAITKAQDVAKEMREFLERCLKEWQ